MAQELRDSTMSPQETSSVRAQTAPDNGGDGSWGLPGTAVCGAAAHMRIEVIEHSPNCVVRKCKVGQAGFSFHHHRRLDCATRSAAAAYRLFGHLPTGCE